MYVCRHVCIYVCMYVCMYIYYIIHTHTHLRVEGIEHLEGHEDSNDAARQEA